MDWKEGIELLSFGIGHIVNLVLLLLWRFIHIVISLWFIATSVIETLESYLISLGLVKHYNSINVDKLRYLAIVVESEEALEISKVVELLQCLKTIGVRRICLFDSQGLLKKSKDLILGNILGSTLLEKDSLPNDKRITLEFISSSDNKDAVAKAANVLLQKCLKSINLENEKGENIFTESQLSEALKVIGNSVEEPDLMLVYGPVRCHLGFPAWRLRYTEIIHMGSLKTIKYGSLVKAIHKFTRVRQNYGV